VRLLYVTTVSATLRRFLTPFSYHFRAQGWRVDGMAHGASECAECVEAYDSVWEVPWSRNPLDPRNLLVAPQYLRRLVVEEGYDLVHVHTPVAAFSTRYALRALRKSGKPRIIYTAHGFHFHEGGRALQNTLYLGLEKLAGQWTDHLVVINNEDRDAVRSHRIVLPDRLHYVPGIGVDTQVFRPELVSTAELLALRAEIGMEPEDKLFLVVASFDPGKRHSDAIHAFARLSNNHTHLALAGNGPIKIQMEVLAKELGIRQRVHFLGHRNDIPVLMRASVALALPSEREGLSRSVMESLSMEVPVIGTDIRGIRSLLEGGCGLLVRVGDVEALTGAMAWMLDHPHEARAMGRRGRRQMAAYDLRQILALHEQLYERALGD
jgi:glycosyltransferase involved in cell wall biosynthesis